MGFVTFINHLCDNFGGGGIGTELLQYAADFLVESSHSFGDQSGSVVLMKANVGVIVTVLENCDVVGDVRREDSGFVVCLQKDAGGPSAGGTDLATTDRRKRM